MVKNNTSKNTQKKRVRRLIIIASAVLISAGLIVGGVIVTSYHLHQRQVNEVIERLDKRFDEIDKYSDSNQGESDKKPSGSAPSPDKDSKGGGDGADNTPARGSMDIKEFPYDIDADKLKEDSIKYNEHLKSTQSQLLVGEESYTYAALDLSKYGIYDNVYGYVSAPAIGMKLPIYLGVTDENMAYGAAHFCYTSLPTGGESTNCVLAGHTGYIGRWLFDDIHNLEEGNEIEVRTYIGTIKYKVAEIKHVMPGDSNDIYIKKGEDRLTLVTCTYASDGTYMRCMVICER